MTTLILATRNAHKIQEITAILGGAFRLFSLKEFPEAPAVAEDQPTLAQNASKKARALAKWLTFLPNADFRLPGASASVLADDSGLEVDALNGAPGVHSARFAALDDASSSGSARNCTDADNNTKLLRLLQCAPRDQRAARFRCVLSLIAVKPPQPTLAGHLFEGVCEGRIALEPAGQGGFGYDPLFIPRDHQLSFAELGPEVKNQISHRAQALARMRKALENLVVGDEMPSF